MRFRGEKTHRGFMPLRRAISVLLIMCVSLAAGCSDKYKTKEDLLKDGLKIMGANNPGGAIVLFKKALDRDENFYEARFQLAKAYREVGKLKSAENELLKVVRQDPASEGVHIELAKVYLMQGRPDDALRETSGYISGGTINAEALEAAALAYSIKGDNEAAVGLLKKIPPSGAEGGKAGIALASIYAKTGRLDDAKLQVLAVLEKEPTNYKALGVLGQIQEKTGDIDGALRTYEQVVKADPANMDACARETVILLEKGESDKALLLADTIMKKFPKNREGYRLKGIVLYYKKNFADAVALLEKSVSIGPDARAYYFIGLCRYSMGEPEQAITELQRASELAPTFAEAGILSSVIMLRRNRPDDAVREITNVLNRDANNAFAHDVLGSAYIAKGMYAEGMAEVDKAIDLNPKILNFYVQKSRLELKNGNVKEAETALAAAVKVNPEVLQPRVVLGSYYLRQREYQKAMNMLQQGITGRKEDAVLYDMIAEALSQQGKDAEAIKYLEKAKASDPKNGLAYFKLASIYVRGGEQGRAYRELKSLVDMSPGNASAYQSIAEIYESVRDEGGALYYYQKAKATGRLEGYYALARYYLKRNKAGEALQTLGEALGKEPDNVGLMSDMAGIYMKMGRKQDAVETASKIISKKPDSPAGYATLAGIYQAGGELDKAVDVLKKPVPGKDLATIMMLGNIYEFKKDYAAALGQYRKAGSMKPGYLPPIFRSACVFQSMNRKQEAQAEYQRVLKIEKDHVPSLNNLAYMYAEDDSNSAEALRLAARASALAPDSGNIQDTFGYVLLKNRRVEEALKTLQKAARLLPGNPAVYYHLALAYKEQGNKALAAENLRKALSLGDFPDAANARGLLKRL